MKKSYLWFIGPILAGLLGLGFSGNWQLGLWLFLATGIGNHIAFKGSQRD